MSVPSPELPGPPSASLLHEPAVPTFPPAADGAPAVTPSERNWAVAAHLGALFLLFTGLGFVAPLAVLLTGGARSPYVRRQAVETLNFSLSLLLWAMIGLVLVLVLVGLLILAGLAVVAVVSGVLGAVAASRGEEYRYPLTLRLVS